MGNLLKLLKKIGPNRNITFVVPSNFEDWHPLILSNFAIDRFFILEKQNALRPQELMEFFKLSAEFKAYKMSYVIQSSKITSVEDLRKYLFDINSKDFIFHKEDQKLFELLNDESHEDFNLHILE
jgi:ADP-heptose:LPS heptosyltransferase